MNFWGCKWTLKYFIQWGRWLLCLLGCSPLVQWLEARTAVSHVCGGHVGYKAVCARHCHRWSLKLMFNRLWILEQQYRCFTVEDSCTCSRSGFHDISRKNLISKIFSDVAQFPQHNNCFQTFKLSANFRNRCILPVSAVLCRTLAISHGTSVQNLWGQLSERDRRPNQRCGSAIIASSWASYILQIVQSLF